MTRLRRDGKIIRCDSAKTALAVVDAYNNHQEVVASLLECRRRLRDQQSRVDNILEAGGRHSEDVLVSEKQKVILKRRKR